MKASNFKSPKITAFLLQITSGKKVTDKAKIIDLLAKGPATLDILILHGFKIQTAAARLSELEDEGIIYKGSGKTKDMSWFYLEDDELQQDIRKANRLQEKKESYFSRGIELGYITQEQLSNLQRNVMEFPDVRSGYSKTY